MSTRGEQRRWRHSQKRRGPANSAPDVESALRYLTAATQQVLGDKEAHLRLGGLRASERQCVVSGIFLITPNRQHNLLVAEHGFPPEQHRLRIPYSQNIRTRLPTGSYAFTIAALRLVFLSTITDTHRQYGRKVAGER